MPEELAKSSDNNQKERRKEGEAKGTAYNSSNQLQKTRHYKLSERYILGLMNAVQLPQTSTTSKEADTAEISQSPFIKTKCIYSEISQQISLEKLVNKINAQQTEKFKISKK